MQLPLTFNPKALRPGLCLVTLTCQNQGTGVDENIKIDFRIEKKGMLHNVTSEYPNRMEVIQGGAPSSSYVSFAIRNLLPNEYQSASLLITDNVPFEAKLWSQNCGSSPEVFIFDVLFGETEKVPPPKFKEQPL